MSAGNDAFPRGGFKPKPGTDTGKKKQPIKQDNLFGNVLVEKKGKGKKNRRSLPQNNGNPEDAPAAFLEKTQNSASVSADTLSYKKIQQGMTVLACVKLPHVMTVDVELPGRCNGEILVQNISNAYTKLVSSAVQDDESKDLPTVGSILKPGMFLPVKVIEIEEGDKLRVFVSCNPSDVNSHLKFSHFTKDMLVWGAINEKSDHGYMIDLGVRNCRVHLPFTAIDEGVEYNVGQVLYMVVTKYLVSRETTTLTLSALRKDFDETVESPGTSLDRVIPGMQIKLCVQKHLKDGLEVQYFDECTGFINELYLKNLFDSMKKYEVFRSFTARLLYLHPISKLGYFTLRSVNENIPENKHRVGLRMASSVVGRAGPGLIIKLQDGSKGYITHRRLLQTIAVKTKENEDFTTLIASKFPAGTNKHCTILDYNHLERMYICTYEEIKEVMHHEELQLAQVIKGTIKSINKHGLLLKIGKLEGFVPNDNLSNVRYSENIKQKFKVGQEVTTKIWNIKPETKDLILTLKPELIANNTHLTSYKDALYSEQYPGVVINTTPQGVLLLFYGGVRGLLPARNIPQLEGRHKDARNEFYTGQVVKCRVANCHDDKLILTLNLSERKRIRVGRIITNPKITKVSDEGLHVQIKTTEALVPCQQLAIEGLGTLMKDTYKVNDILDEELICIIDSTPPILSVREHVAYKRDGLRIPHIYELKPGVVIRALVKENVLAIPVKADKLDVPVNANVFKTEKYESLLARVEKCVKKKLTMCTKLHRVFNYSYLETLQYLDQYLDDIQRLRERYLHSNNPMVDLEIGATVDCVVGRVDLHRGCSVTIQPMNCQGLVSLNDCHNVEEGKKLKGKILWVNYKMKYAAVTLQPKLMKNMNDMQNQKIDIDELHDRNDLVKVHILHANNFLAVGLLRRKYSRQLVYLPVKVHENDVKPSVNMYDPFIGKELKAKLVKMKSGRLLAIPQLLLEKMHGRMKACGELIKLRTLKEKPTRKPKVDIKEDDESGVDVKTEDEDDEVQETNMEVDSDEIKDEIEEPEEEVSEDEPMQTVVEVVDKKTGNKRKLSEDKTTTAKKSKNESQVPILPGISSFFDEVDEPTEQQSDDEEQSKTTKKKLTPAERKQIAKDEEERLRKIETELADETIMPQNAEQFDRALLGNPDDSELWTKYIAFHAQSTEFDKARCVAQRAFERISYTALQDRLNVWLAFLNLENMYGTKDSFDKAFEEAARSNDTMTIYLETIKMLSEMGKFREMEDKVKKARGKFKQELQMWLEIGKVYYKCGRFAEARKLKDNALVTLIDKKTHIQLIVQFAIMEFNFGEANQGEALFETILQADPKRVDIWCTYVDQLIKKEKTDLARNVLSRAAGQKLPYKKMRTLFKKYHTFEKTYGDELTLAQVTKLLKEYGDQ